MMQLSHNFSITAAVQISFLMKASDPPVPNEKKERKKSGQKINAEATVGGQRSQIHVVRCVRREADRN